MCIRDSNQGYTGSQGIQGNSGYTGSTGSQGTAGYTGSTGVGYTGSTGTFATGQNIVAGNVTINGGLNANGSYGNYGQVLASNGSGVYWTTDQVGNSVTANTIVASTLAADSINIGIGWLTIGNSTVNTVITNTSIRVATSNTTTINTTYANTRYIFANSSYGNAGQVLTSNGTGIYWASESFANSVSANSINATSIVTSTLAADSMTIGIGILSVGNSTVNTQITNSSIIALSITANNTKGAAGSVLTSNGTGMFWSNTVNTLQATSITANVLSADSLNLGSGYLTVGNSTSNSIISNTSIITNTANVINLNARYANVVYLTANGVSGTASQVLTSNSSGGVYWSTTVGYTGSQGTTGYSGSTGNNGYTGSIGSQGNIGYTGSIGVGYTGSSGSGGGGGGYVTISDTAPSSPAAGQLWFYSVTGETYIWIPSTSSWVSVTSTIPQTTALNAASTGKAIAMSIVFGG